MSWNELTPIAKITPRAKAYISVIKGGIVRLNVSFSETMLKELGHRPEKARVSIGSDENTGLVRLFFCEKGEFDVSLCKKGGARMILPANDSLPDYSTETFPCEIVKRGDPTTIGDLELILRLPMREWAASGKNKPAAFVAPKPAITPKSIKELSDAMKAQPSSVTRLITPQKQTDKLDPVEYLRKRGHTISKQPNGAYLIDGSMSPVLEVLRLVNQHRKNSSLPPLIITDLAA